MEHRTPRLVILRGLPGSGKSTIARQLMADGYARLNKDDLRNMLFGDKYEHSKHEYVVSRVQEKAAVALMIHGRNIVLDNTHGHEKAFKDIKRAAMECGYEVEERILDTPIEECITRDACRIGRDHVGEAVIRKILDAPFFQVLYGLESEKDLAHVVL